jgi:hypothetical protein
LHVGAAVGGTLDSIGWLLVAVLLLLALAAAVIAIRRYLLERGGGTVECALRAPAGGAWRPGVASYHPDELYWYRAVGILLRPDRVFTRRSLRVLSRRPATSPGRGGTGRRPGGPDRARHGLRGADGLSRLARGVSAELASARHRLTRYP